MNTLKKWAPLIVGVLLCAGLTAGVAMDQPSRNTPNPHDVPCATEDSNNCYWDASIMGNGSGRSFTTIAGTPYYWDGQP